MDNLSETSLHGSLAELEEETGQVSTQELEDYLQIITKPAETRTKKEIEKLIAKLIDMDIFDKALLENLDAKPVVTKLIPFLKYEQFPAGAPIFHYEQSADKLYIIIRGKAREFVPKNLDTIEKESRLHYRSDPIPKDVSLAIADMPTPTSLTALTNLPETPFGSLETIYEQTTGEKVSTPSGAAKKFRKMKALFPFLKKMIAQKTATQRISDYSYKQSLRKPRKVHYNQDPSEIHLENMGTNIDGDILEEFKRFPKTYFIGGVLKVQFSKYLFAGDYCGQRALKDNALRTLAVIAEEECHCISLHKDDFLEVLGHERSVNADKIDFFKKLFDKYDEKIITKFSLLWEHQTLKMGDIVFQENEPSEYVYALFKGEIIISKTPPNAKKTRNSLTQDLPFRIKKRHEQNDQAIRVATLCPKDFFGDADFFQGSPREFTASVSSIRAKIFRLPLDKFKSAYRRYHDIFTQIKTMTSLKLQWNKERFGDINNSQSSTQIYPQSLGTILEKEKALVQVGQLLSPSNNARSPVQNYSTKLKESFEPYRTDVLKQTFSQQNVSLVDPKPKMHVTSSIWGGEKSKFSSPKSSTFFGGDYSHKADTKLVDSAKRENFDTKAKHHSSLEIEDSNDMQLFNRMRPPREYSCKQEEILKKHKEGPIETSIHFFTPKKTASNKKLLDSSKTKNSTRGSSIQVLKRKVFDTRLEEYGVYPGTSQKGNSIELDKPQSLVFSQSTMGTIPSLNSINDKVQKPSMCSLVSPSSRRSKPLSMDKINLMSSCENGKGSDSKKVPVNFHVSKLLDHPKKNENGAYYLAPGMRLSVKSRCNDMSKNTSTIQMLSPKADSNDENNFSSFRVIGIVPAKGNHDTMRSSVGNMKNSHIYSQC